VSETYESLNQAQLEAEYDTFTPERYCQMAKWLPPEGRILDVGCSTGRGGEVLKRVNPAWEVIGLDCLESRLSLLPKPAYSGAICSYSTAIDSPENSFQAITAGEFIEHLKPEDVDSTLREFLRILSSEGVLVMTTPNPGYIKLKLTGRAVLGGPHLSEHYPTALASRMKQAGFVDIRVRGTGRVSNIVGTHFPLMNCYGSYMIVGTKR
jgi:2-polyprenyl-3-methyl-5-hydroxy-6-metoxy-1,4-benzoquinol methylase